MAQPKETNAADMSGLEGKILQFPSHGIVLIMDGKARGIPNVPTFQNMFGATKPENKEDAWYKVLTIGRNFPDGCCLVKAQSDAIYLMDLTNDNKLVKRHLLPDAMSKYKFNQGTPKDIPNIVMNAIPFGQEITGK